MVKNEKFSATFPTIAEESNKRFEDYDIPPLQKPHHLPHNRQQQSSNILSYNPLISKQIYSEPSEKISKPDSENSTKSKTQFTPQKKNKKKYMHKKSKNQKNIFYQDQITNKFINSVSRITVIDLLFSILLCFLTFFTICICETFVNFVAHNNYFIFFVILIVGLSNKHFVSKTYDRLIKKNE
jgi:hypothetical protein